MAPEVNSGAGYDTSADLYSLGVTMYIMLCDCFPKVPFNSSNEDHYLRLSADAKDLLHSLLDHDPIRRITAVEALSHDWILKNICTRSEVVAKRNGLNCNFVNNEGSRKVNKIKKDIELNLPLLVPGPNFFDDNFVVDVIDGREENEDNSSREFNLRPTCFV